MAEYSEFSTIIPVCGGKSGDGSDLFNVQWASGKYPLAASTPAAVTATAGVSFVLPGSAGEAKLTNCNGRWQWTSTALGQSIDEGTQLAVGMPFTRVLTWFSGPGTPDTFGTVDVFAKYMVNVASRFDNIYLSLCDSTGNTAPTTDLQPTTSDSTWRVVGLRNTSWDGWDNDNLRVLLTFQGTSDYRNVGLTTVEIEWFAVGLK